MGAFTGVGGADLIDIVAGGIPDQSARQWLQERTQAVRGSLTHAGGVFLDRARDLYEVISESHAVQMLRNLRSKRDDVWAGNQIQYLQQLAQLQTAGPIMQRWIMAYPELRQRYLDQTVDGYSESYVNYHGDAVGEQHYDYRRVMDGVVTIPEEADYVLKYYFDMQPEEEQQLSFLERVDILKTWDWVSHYLDEGGEDPTSQIGAQL